MIAGDTARVRQPGHYLHGKIVRIARIDPAFDLAHPDCPERMICEVIFVTHLSLPEPIGLWREALTQR